MQKQTESQNRQHSSDIERLMENELKQTVAFYISKYGQTFERKLGLTEDDLLSDTREQVWKGLLTFNKRGKANMKTYLNTLIKNRFLVLLKRSSINKYNSVEYHADVYANPGVSKEHTETDETGETLLERRQELMADLSRLPPAYRFVFGDLLFGFSLGEMEKRHDMTRPEVITAINVINNLIAQRRKAS